MNEYTLVCPLIRGEDHRLSIPLIRKNRPAWQSGRLNLPGGALDEEELPMDGALRELVEETGLKLKSIKRVGTISDVWGVVHIFVGEVLAGQAISPMVGEDQPVEVYSVKEAIEHPDIIDNLRYIIPRCVAAVDGFTGA